MSKDVVASLAICPWHPPPGGECSREEARRGSPPWPPLSPGFILVSFTGKFTNNLGLIACKLITLVLYSCMLLFKHACVFFSRFLLSRNYKVQIVAHVEGKSVALLSGITEASYSHFFIGQGFNCSRSIFYCFSKSFKNYHSEASKRL